MQKRGRDELYTQFVKQFHAGKKPRGCSDADLDKMEKALHATLPASYRKFMRCHGNVYTPSILDLITDRKLDHVDMQELFRPATAAKNTKMYWSGGMPDEFIGIATDCMGNMIGFTRGQPEAERPDDLPVWFFDHDYVEVSRIADGFDDFLMWYVETLTPE